jgi:hypothetical protein
MLTTRIRSRPRKSQSVCRPPLLRSNEYWPADLDALADNTIQWSNVLSSRHSTDAYLLSLAVAKGGRLITLDRHVSFESSRAATPRNLFVLR